MAGAICQRSSALLLLLALVSLALLHMACAVAAAPRPPPKHRQSPPPRTRSPPPKTSNHMPPPKTNTRKPPPRPRATPTITINSTLKGEINIFTLHNYLNGNAEQSGVYPEPPDTVVAIRPQAVDGQYTVLTPTVLDLGTTKLDDLDVLSGDEVEVDVSIEVPADSANGSLSGRRMLLSANSVDGSNGVVDAVPMHRRSLSEIIDEYGPGNVKVKATGGFRVSLQSSGKDFIVNGQPVNLTGVVVVANFQGPGKCKNAARTTAQAVRAKLFKRFAPSNKSATLEGMFETCSWGKLLWKPENVLVADVTMPCYGSRPDDRNSRAPNITFDFRTSCRNPNEFDSWRYFAMQHIQNVLKLPTSGPNAIKRIMVLLPPVLQCPWGGMASSGCPKGSTCLTWVQTGKNGEISLPILFQELMHNTGLYHSNRYFANGDNLEYGDPADPMGDGAPKNAANGIVCMEAPQAWKAGWINPKYQVDWNPSAGGALPQPYTANEYVVPSMSTSDKTLVQILLGPENYINFGARRRSLFLSYRVRSSVVPQYDSGLKPELSQRVLVHEFLGTISPRFTVPRPDPWQTPPYMVGVVDNAAGDNGWLYRGSGGGVPLRKVFGFNTRNDWPLLRPGQTPHPPTYDFGNYTTINIAVKSKNATAAIISVCRSDPNQPLEETTIEACNDNLDNDCDGFVDADDPDCAGLSGRH